jgi:hypothetical protein
MSYGHAQRLAKLEAAATPTARGADIRRHLLDPAAAPGHVRPLVDRWRRFVAASEADAGDDLDAVVARLLEAGFVVDDAMLAAIEQRLAVERNVEPQEQT